MPSKYDKIWSAAAEAEEELIREHDEDQKDIDRYERMANLIDHNNHKTIGDDASREDINSFLTATG